MLHCSFNGDKQLLQKMTNTSTVFVISALCTMIDKVRTDETYCDDQRTIAAKGCIWE